MAIPRRAPSILTAVYEKIEGMDQLKAPSALAMADANHLPPGELVATFTDRREVNKAIEFLASQKFPVHSLYVVGHDVQQVDYVTGQATYPRAALGGVFQGLSLGALVALFNAVITQTSILANFLSIVPLAIAFCMIYSIFVASRAKGRGIRTRTQLMPSRFDLMAIPATAQAARHLLRVTVHPSGPQSGVHGPGAHPFENSRPTSSPYIHPGMSQANPQGYSAQQPQAGQSEQDGQAGSAQGAPQWFDPNAPASQRPVAPEPFLPGFNPADQKQEAEPQPQEPASPVFTPPAETNRDGSKAAGKFGLRVESAEEFEQMIRKTPEPPTTHEWVEEIRAQQGEQRYGLRVETPEEFEATIRKAPEAADTEQASQKDAP